MLWLHLRKKWHLEILCNKATTQQGNGRFFWLSLLKMQHIGTRSHLGTTWDKCNFIRKAGYRHGRGNMNSINYQKSKGGRLRFNKSLILFASLLSMTNLLLELFISVLLNLVYLISMDGNLIMFTALWNKRLKLMNRTRLLSFTKIMLRIVVYQSSFKILFLIQDAELGTQFLGIDLENLS